MCIVVKLGRVGGWIVVEQEGGWTHKEGFPGGGGVGIRVGDATLPHPLFLCF